MDTKLRNYDGAKKFGCFVSGLGFIASFTLLAERVCKIFWLYDFKLFLSWALDEQNISLPSDEELGHMSILLSETWKGALFFAGVGFALLALCIWLTGKKPTWFDKIFMEIQVVLVALAVTGIVGMGYIFFDCLERSQWYQTLVDMLGFTAKEQLTLYAIRGGHSHFEPQWLESFFCYAATAVLIGICLLLLLSWVKKIKARCFWRYSLVGALILGTGDAIRESRGVQGKVILLLVIGAILSATWIGLIVVLVFIIFFVPRQLKKYKAIRDGVAAVKDGNLDAKITTLRPGEKPGELDRLANDINAISEATSIAVANELKNQRMKTDLISNVSHDLKTPLTSMVSYVDLLKTEGLDSPNALEYLDIIDEKTRRLRKLTEDLFEAAKASSGAIPVHIERIDMTAIVQQALAEVEGRLTAADLMVIYENRAEVPYVWADGQLLWRVMENLLVNVSKYALPGSRVYVDVREQEDSLRLEIKNMSKDRLNIDAEELMERFKRGDESRNTEGSGLGLAIAKDLVGLMGGSFDLTVDGDLFKVTVGLERA